MGIYRLCRVFRCLPYPGGVMNQPKYAIERLEAIMEANDRIEKEELENIKKESK